MITYAKKDLQTTKVKLDGKFVGSIIESKKGFRYFPKNIVQAGGDFFATLAECKLSLEAD